MKTIDTEHRLEAPASHLELPAPKVQMLLESGKQKVDMLLNLTEAEQDRLKLAELFGISKEKIMALIVRDREEGRKSVFERVKTHTNDERLALAV